MRMAVQKPCFPSSFDKRSNEEKPLENIWKSVLSALQLICGERRGENTQLVYSESESCNAHISVSLCVCLFVPAPTFLVITLPTPPWGMFKSYNL